MTVLAAAILAVVFGPSALLIAYALVVLARRRRARQLPTLSHRQCADNGRPCVEIDIAPRRAPRNGNTYDPVK